MEILIVMTIIVILTAAVGFMAVRYVEKSRRIAARDQIETLSLALHAYALDCKRYPTEEQGLDALWIKPVLEPLPTRWAGPYVSKKIGADPWDHPYEYTVPGPNALPFALRSFASDGKEGGEGNDKDIASWED
jgi:general secretion pathway protein G